MTLGGISYFPTGDVNRENYPVGSRVEYHCRPANIRPNIENGNDQPEIGLRTCRSVDGSGWSLAWNITVLCNRDGQWEQSITEQVTKRPPNNSSIIFTTEPPLMDPSPDISTSYWVFIWNYCTCIFYLGINSSLLYIKLFYRYCINYTLHMF